MILLITLLALANSSSQALASDPASCDMLYQNRNMLPKAFEALTCLKKLQAETRSTDATTYRAASEYALQTTIWLYTRSPESERAKFADEGLALANEVDQSLPQSGLGPYWRSVFHVMKCRVLDTGMIPTCFMKMKGTIIDLLKKARAAEIAVHGYGPSRTLGILYREMPSIVGGDRKLAKFFGEESLKGASRFSTNILETAKTQITQKEKDEARMKLTAFTKTPCLDIDPARIPECSIEKQEANAILKKLK